MLKTIFAAWAALMGAGFAATLAGCGGGSTAATAPAAAQQPRILSVSANQAPEQANGATATIAVQFSMPMDTASVENRVHMYRGDAETGTPVPGAAAWSQDNTLMTFTPAEPMMAGATHTMHFDAGITGASDGHMMGGGHMMDQESMVTVMVSAWN